MGLDFFSLCLCLSISQEPPADIGDVVLTSLVVCAGVGAVLPDTHVPGLS